MTNSRGQCVRCGEVDGHNEKCLPRNCGGCAKYREKIFKHPLFPDGALGGWCDSKHRPRNDDTKACPDFSEKESEDG